MHLNHKRVNRPLWSHSIGETSAFKSPSVWLYSQENSKRASLDLPIRSCQFLSDSHESYILFHYKCTHGYKIHMIGSAFKTTYKEYCKKLIVYVWRDVSQQESLCQELFNIFIFGIISNLWQVFL